MAEREYILPTGNDLVITRQAADALLGSRNAAAALLYLYILRHDGLFSAREAAANLGLASAAVASALRDLSALGLVRSTEQPAADSPAKSVPVPDPVTDTLPTYTAADVTREMKEDPVFSALVPEVSQVIGRALSTEDVMKLLGIYDSLGLPAEVILHLASHCAAEAAARPVPKRVSMRTIEKTAYVWEREGINSIASAEAYLRRLDNAKSFAEETRAVLQIRDRDLTTTERKYVENWQQMGFTVEIIGMAYERTVMKTGKLAWNYMNSILSSWNEKKLYTREAIEKGDTRPGKQPSKPEPAERQSGPTEAELLRMQKLMEKMRK